MASTLSVLSSGSAWVLISGVVGTTAMILSMVAIGRITGANTDMARAIGSLWTGKYSNALWPGVITHYLMGICFASIYLLVAGFAPITTASGIVYVTLGLGWVHGIIVGLFLTVSVAEHHPLEAFRRAGFDVVFAHAFGHLVYGLAVGFTFVLLEQALSAAPYIHGVLSLKSLIQAEAQSGLWLPIFCLPLLFISFFIARTLNTENDSDGSFDPALDDSESKPESGLFIVREKLVISEKRRDHRDAG